MSVSSGLSQAKEGERLISRSQGLRSESSKTSNPNSSKQLVLYEQFLFIPEIT